MHEKDRGRVVVRVAELMFSKKKGQNRLSNLMKANALGGVQLIDKARCGDKSIGHSL